MPTSVTPGGKTRGTFSSQNPPRKGQHPFGVPSASLEQRLTPAPSPSPTTADRKCLDLSAFTPGAANWWPLASPAFGRLDLDQQAFAILSHEDL